MSKEGLGLVIPALVLSIASFCLFFFFDLSLFFIIAVFLSLLTIFLVFSFRDPKREIPKAEDLILSPADGKLISIDPFPYHPFLDSGGKKISIFMSMMDVHINRTPVSGIVKDLKYTPGKFYPSFSSKSSEKNEQNEIWIENEKGNIALKQIAGFLARRIICQLKKGNRIEAGEKFGMIKLGSRAEIFLPEKTKILVKLKQKVKAGETPLAKF